MTSQKIDEVMELQFNLLNLIHKNFSKVFHEIEDGPYTLNKNQKKAIMIIGAKGEIIPSALGKYLDLQKGSLTSMIDTLEKEALICRRRDPQDRRKILISLTEKGREYRDWLIAEVQRILSRVLEKLNEAEINSYEESLKNLIESIQKLDERN